MGTADNLAALDAYMTQSHLTGIHQAIGLVEAVADRPRSMGGTGTIPADHVRLVAKALHYRLVTLVNSVAVRTDAPDAPTLARRLRLWADYLDAMHEVTS